MNKPTPHTQIGGAAARIGDCYVWSEIHYLDSASDFRESLPPQTQSELVMLDEITPSLLWVFCQDLAGKLTSLVRGFANIVRLCFKISR
jgi:hypothetical protein